MATVVRRHIFHCLPPTNDCAVVIWYVEHHSAGHYSYIYNMQSGVYRLISLSVCLSVSLPVSLSLTHMYKHTQTECVWINISNKYLQECQHCKERMRKWARHIKKNAWEFLIRQNVLIYFTVCFFLSFGFILFCFSYITYITFPFKSSRDIRETIYIRK